jgi:hypothetical protein
MKKYSYGSKPSWVYTVFTFCLRLNTKPKPIALKKMSGAGRRTCYRKGVTAQVLYGDPEPKENECIVKVVERRGNNLFEVFSLLFLYHLC